jgi:hypothetical protein
MLSVQDLEPGYFGSMRKDVSDSEWHVFSQNLLRSCPWLFLHLIGTQYFKKKNQPVYSHAMHDVKLFIFPKHIFEQGLILF